MNKMYIVITLLFLKLFTSSFAEEKIELFPEVKALIAPKPLDPKLLENSLSIGLLGIFNPDDNYYEISKELFEINYPILEEGDTSVSSKNLISFQTKLPEGQKMLDWSKNTNQIYDELKLCSEYLSKNCVEKAIEFREKLELLLIENQKLLQRYDDLVRNSKQHVDQQAILWNFETDLGLEILKGYQGINKYSLLTLNRALLQLDKNEMNEAIGNLQQVQKILWLLAPDNESVSLISQMMAVTIRSNFDTYLNAILNYGYLNDQLNNPNIEKLFKPYPDTYRQGLIQSYAMEYDLSLRSLKNSKEYQIDNNILNQYYLLGQEHIKSLQNNTFDEEKDKLLKSCKALNIKNDVCGYSFDVYSKRYDLQSNYHNMVYLKYLILRDKIKDENIPEFLKFQGKIAIDSITQEPFKWNPETRTIYSSLPEAKILSVNIRKVILENPEVKYLQVTIPQQL